MAENLITPAELAAYAPELDTSAFSETTISGMIGRASEMARKYCNVDGFILSSVTSETSEMTINPDGELIISFRRRPVAQGDVTRIRLQTVDIDNDLQLQSGAGNDVYFIPTGGRYLIYPSSYLIAHGDGLVPLTNSRLLYNIDYTGGYAEIPDDLKEAVTLYMRHLVQRRLNPAGAQSFTQGSYSVNYGQGQSGAVDQFTLEAQKLLNDGGYVRRVLS